MNEENFHKEPLNNSEMSGAFKKRSNELLEQEVLQTLKKLSINVTEKDIKTLLQTVQTSTDLDGLREELKHLQEGAEIADDILQEVNNLLAEIRNITESGLNELRLNVESLQMGRLQPYLEQEVLKGTYFSDKFPGISTKLENSPLWKNLVIDIAGLAVGMIDSVMAILTVLLALVVDLFMLPKDLMVWRKK